jgi:hypothetical protein
VTIYFVWTISGQAGPAAAIARPVSSNRPSGDVWRGWRVYRRQGCAEIWCCAHAQLGCTPLETVAAAAPDARRMAQLYVRGNDGFVHDFLRRVGRGIPPDPGYRGLQPSRT